MVQNKICPYCMKTFKEFVENDELFIDEDDKKRILSMPELQREQKLHERYTRIKEAEMSKLVKELDRKKEVHPAEAFKPRPRVEGCDFVVQRDTIVNNVFKPSIGVLKGAFVRAMINKRYIICKVVGFSKTDLYPLMDKFQNMCSLGLKLDTGSRVVENVQVTSVSSSGVTSEEFDAFLESFDIKSLDSVKDKFSKVKQELSRSLTDAEITKMVENRLEDNPKKMTSTERKIEIIAKRDEAIQAKNKQKALLYQNQLEQIEDEERAERKRKFLEDSEKRKRKTYN